MHIYLLKFTACLFVLWFIYYALLERQKNHKFKRFYLLGSIALSVIIPLLTITQYVEPADGTNEIITTVVPFESVPMEVPVETQEPFNWSILLWTLYGLGAALFGFRFIGNLWKLYITITKREKLSIGSFIYVLLDRYRTPHSFFWYIFLNKDKYNTNDIPKEVLIHEETHAKQWHSADILLVELVQIVFWFHPLIYIIKHHVKLNHEFLADQAVLDKGIDTKAYQKTLLQFSSSTSNQNLASAINYSSIKKRFTVMKKKTSKTRMWLSSLLLLPIIAILFYSFAEKEYVEKEKSRTISTQSVIFEQDSRLQYYDSITTKYSEAIEQFLKGARSDNSALKTLKTQADAIYNSFTNEELSKHNILPPPPVPVQKRQKLPTQKEIEQYNAWAKKCNKQMAKANKDNSNEYPIVKLKDYKRFKAIYDSMSAEQRENAESFPEKFATLPPKPPKPPKPHLELKPKRNEKNVSPPPAPPKPKNMTEAYAKKHHESVSKVKINGEIVEVVEIPSDQEGTTEIHGKEYKYVTKDGLTTYYDSKGKKYNEHEFNKYIESQKSLKMKLDNSEDDTNISGLKGMSFTFSSLKNAKKIDWDLEKAFKENFEKLNNGDSIRVVLEIDDKIMVDNKIIKDYKSEFIGTFGEIDIMYEKIKNHIKELKRK